MKPTMKTLKSIKISIFPIILRLLKYLLLHCQMTWHMFVNILKHQRRWWFRFALSCFQTRECFIRACFAVVIDLLRGQEVGPEIVGNTVFLELYDYKHYIHIRSAHAWVYHVTRARELTRERERILWSNLFFYAEPSMCKFPILYSIREA